jgi:uncharacterized protein (TIGR00730 family)
MWKKYFKSGGDTAEPTKEISHTAEKRISTILKEVRGAFTLLHRYPRLVTFFGSSRTPAGTKYYEAARHLAHRIADELGYAVITGGGPGIMEAANRGAYEAGGESIGMQIVLPHAQILNKFLTDHLTFYFLFVRRLSLSFTAEAYMFFPGGYGTLDEFFEVIELIQTKKIHPVPVILYGREYWEPLDAFIKMHLLEKFDMVDAEDLSIYKIIENEDEILSIIKKAPLRKE